MSASRMSRRWTPGSLGAFEAGVIAFDTETDALSCSNAGLCGISIAIQPGEAAYIPVGHCAAAGLDLTEREHWTQLGLEEAIARLKPLLEDPTVLKVAQNGKYDIAVMSRYGVHVAPVEDTMLMSYVLDAGLHNHGMDELKPAPPRPRADSVSNRSPGSARNRSASPRWS